MEKLHGFEQLRKKVGLKPLKPRKEKPVICKKCGAEMVQVAQNMWQCQKEIPQKKGDAKICGNIYIRHNYN